MLLQRRHLLGVKMRTKLILAGLVSAATVVLATTGVAERKAKPTQPGTSGPEWIISCYRGPFTAVAWDRPNAVFVDDLIEYGYTPTQAIAIGKRVCRDEWGVHNEEYLKQTLLRIISEQPPKR